MNFLLKIEDAINNAILKILEKMKALMPHFLMDIAPKTKNFAVQAVHVLSAYPAKLKAVWLKTLGYFKSYFTVALGHFTAFSIFLRSDEFKHNKFSIITKPYKYCITYPIQTFLGLFVFSFVSYASFLIYTNTQAIVVGTKKLRAPASAHEAEYVNENEIEFRNHKFEVALKGGHGAGAHREEEVFFDIKIEASSKESKELLEEMEEKLDVELESFSFDISGLPVSEDERKSNEKALKIYLNQEFLQLAHGDAIKNITLKQSPKKRPVYFGQEDRTFSLKDVSLQIFLEDTHRNRQVFLDYSLLASNRNVVLYLKDHEAKVRDRLSTHVEPIIPRLPIEDEGRLIIKDKIRFELNELLKEEKIEGRILEVYIDYILAS